MKSIIPFDSVAVPNTWLCSGQLTPLYYCVAKCQLCLVFAHPFCNLD